MTRVDLAVPQAPLAGTAGSRRQDPNGGFEEADAGFLAQLAMVAAEENGASSLPGAKNASEATIARWWQAGPGPVPMLTPDENGGEIEIAEMHDGLLAAAALAMELPAEATVATVDTPAGVDPEPETEGDQQSIPMPLVRDPMTPIGALPISAVTSPALLSAAVAVAMGPPSLPAAPVDLLPGTLPPEPWQPVAKDLPVPSTLPAVTVVRTETHFAPVAPIVPIAALTPMPPAGKPAPAEPNGPVDSRKPDQPGGAKPAILHPTIQGNQSAGHPLPQATADHPDGDTSQQDTSGESAAPMTALSARGLAQAAQPTSAPTQQIADEIVANLAPSRPADLPPAPPAAPRPGAMHPVKVLTIQLHPAELGTVTVRMTLKGDAMDVEVEAGRRATAQAIDADRETLSGLLRSAGYHVEVLTVRAVDPASAASSPGSLPGSADAGPQLQSGGGQPDARASGNRAQPEPRSFTQLPDRNDHDGEQATGDRRGTGLYV